MEYKVNKDYGYDLHIVTTEKFKTNTISLKFSTELKRDNITARALLPSILFAGCKKYKTKRELTTYLEELYDASIGLSMSKVGNLSIINVGVSFINDKYVDEAILPKMIEVINEVIFNPLIEDGKFDESKLDEEKRLLTESIESITDDKTGYALEKLKENMYADEKFKIRSIGYLEDFDSITTESLYDEYLEMINNDKVEVIITGKYNDLSPFKNLSFQDNKTIVNKDLETKEITKTSFFTEVQNINQAKLNIGYRTEIRYDDELYMPMVVGNSILGSAPNSMLFQTLREKHSLCYYIRSSYSPYKGSIHIFSGINPDQYEKSLKLIREEISKLQAGDFSDELFSNTLKSLVNDLLEMMDRQGPLSNKTYQDILMGRDFDINSIIERIKNVKKEDVMKATSLLKEDTIFLLTNEEVVWKE
ncbi:pitrilysin family protein [Mycoplasmatota bacterium WC44]